jgi:hypothetical protein
MVSASVLFVKYRYYIFAFLAKYATTIFYRPMVQVKNKANILYEFIAMFGTLVQNSY